MVQACLVVHGGKESNRERGKTHDVVPTNGEVSVTTTQPRAVADSAIDKN